MRPLLFTLILLSACGQPKGPLREPDEYVGCGADEHWRTFDDQEKFATVADATAPSVTAPTSGSALPASPKPVITWNQDSADPGMPLGDVIHDGAGCTDCCPQWNPGGLTVMHDPPISGSVYDLQFSADGQLFYRVVTTLQEWSPLDTGWPNFLGKTVSLKIYRMVLLRNDLAPGTQSGPFVATEPFTFTVAQN